MPELPEVERVRQALAATLPGRTIAAVRLARADVVRGPADGASLLSGRRVKRVVRRGKQLALVGEAGDGREPVVCVHLGMTGSLVCEPGRLGPGPAATPAVAPLHTHVVWHFTEGGTLRFTDVRRFGGLWVFPDWRALEQQRWHRLGGDALTIQPRALHRRLQRTRRAIKTALLDQQVIAGLGNIYADELLFAARLAPTRPADTLSLPRLQRMVRQMRRLLGQAIDAGGSTFRDYVDAAGQPGGFQNAHRVYGRAGRPCRRCATPLAASLVAGRTTVHCPRCQPER